MIGIDTFLANVAPIELGLEYVVDLVFEYEMIGLEGVVRFDPRGLALAFNFALYEYTPPVGTAARFDSTDPDLMLPPLVSLTALDVEV
jgi:hypothetical protein